MKPLIVHEWFEKYGGSEQVVGAFATAYPTSDLFCLWAADDVSPPVAKVFQSILSSSVFNRNKIALLPAMPLVWRANRDRLVAEYDFVLISSHLFAHHFRVPKGIAKIVYVHTPARYIWEPELDPRGRSALVKLASKFLKPLDRFRAQDSTHLIANSKFVADRIQRHWGRLAPVVYPPVDFDFYATQTETTLNFNNIPTIASWRGRYVLGASRFTSQKRLDLVIWSAKWLGLPVVIAGAGPELVNLQSLAKRLSVDAYFALNPSKEFLRDLYQNSAFFAYPPVEDFGIMPVEAMASGAAVLGLNKGGTSESVVDGETGVLIPEFSQDYVLKAWDTLRRISSDACRSRALKFDEANFQLNLLREIEIALVKVGEA